MDSPRVKSQKECTMFNALLFFEKRLIFLSIINSFHLHVWCLFSTLRTTWDTSDSPESYHFGPHETSVYHWLKHYFKRKSYKYYFFSLQSYPSAVINWTNSVTKIELLYIDYFQRKIIQLFSWATTLQCDISMIKGMVDNRFCLDSSCVLLFVVDTWENTK